MKNWEGRWALVTGASSGIGAEFVRQLAGRGVHVAMAARRVDQMRELADSLTSHGTKFEIFESDLSLPAGPGDLFKAVTERGLKIDLLVNNAGFGQLGHARDTEPALVADMLRVNVNSLTELTYLFLPGLRTRDGAAVLNVASVAAFQPIAFMPVYAASKAYVLHFSEALTAEMRTAPKTERVGVVALCPGTTRTAFFDRAGAAGWLDKHFSSTVEDVVGAGLRGVARRRRVVIPGLRNRLMTSLPRLFPRFLVTDFTTLITKPR